MKSFIGVSLSSERLTLRPFRESDAGPLYAIFSDPRVARYLTTPPWASEAVARERISNYAEAMSDGKYLRLGIERRSDGRLLGECVLFNFMDQCRRAEVGYSLGSEAWGKGYMKEALIPFLSFGFSQLNLNRIEAEIDPRNLASAKTLESVGFKREGLFRERWIVGDEVSDSGLYGLLEREWDY